MVFFFSSKVFKSAVQMMMTVNRRPSGVLDDKISLLEPEPELEGIYHSLTNFLTVLLVLRQRLYTQIFGF